MTTNRYNSSGMIDRPAGWRAYQLRLEERMRAQQLMKRHSLLRQLREQGCEFLKEGARHSWWWNPVQNRRSSVSRHVEIDDDLARKICKDLGIKTIR